MLILFEIPQPGFLHGVLAQIKAKTKEMAEAERMCSLVLDEMSIKPHTDYNRRLDSVDGLTSDGRPATQAMVFMARAISGKWKQVVKQCRQKNSDVIHNIKIKAAVGKTKNTAHTTAIYFLGNWILLVQISDGK